MSDLDINQIEKRLTEIIEQERKEAIGYAVLTILCTPVFIAFAGAIVLLILASIFPFITDNITVIGIYTVLNCFLGYMLLFALYNSRQDDYVPTFGFWLVLTEIKKKLTELKKHDMSLDRG